MRGKVAKRLRKMVYGDQSRKSEEIKKQESILMKIINIFNPKKQKNEKIKHVTVRNVGLRKTYQESKKDFKELEWREKFRILRIWEG